MSTFLHRIGMLQAQAGAAPPAPNYYNDVALLWRVREANGATTVIDDSVNGFDGTAVGGAQVQSNVLEMDGTGDYWTVASDAHDYNPIPAGTPFTLELVIAGIPDTSGSHRNTIIDCTGATASKRGVWVVINANRSIQTVIGKATVSSPIIDYTTTYSLPDDALDHHIVIEFDVGSCVSLTNRLRIGVDGVRVAQGDLNGAPNTAWNSIADCSHDALIGSINGIAGLDYDGGIKGIRLWLDRLPFDLGNNSTYDYEIDPGEWPTAEVATGFIPFAPRYVPKEETTAAGKTGSLYYLSESRLLKVGTGEVVMVRQEGPSHAGNTTTVIRLYRSVDYGQKFPSSTAVTVASHGSFSCRNLAAGHDPSSGRLSVFYRTVNGSTVTQDILYKTSTDKGATFSSATSVLSSLSLTTAGAPFGKAVKTSRGFMQPFYVQNKAEALFSTDGLQTWGDRKTIYDVSGAAPGYNEPFAIAVTEDDIVVVARRDGSNNNDFAYYQSDDGGDTWSFVGEVQWTGTSIGLASPLCMTLVGGQVMTTIAPRSPDFKAKYTLRDVADFLTDPRTALDGTEAFIDVHTMKNRSASWSLVTNSEYGYPDVIGMGSSNVLMSWYEPAAFNSATVVRTHVTGFAI